MKYTVIITETQNGDLHATVPGIPECHAHARTRSDAIQAVRHSIAQVLSRSEIVQVDVPISPKATHVMHDTPWKFFGEFRDDMTWGPLEEQRSNSILCVAKLILAYLATPLRIYPNVLRCPLLATCLDSDPIH